MPEQATPVLNMQIRIPDNDNPVFSFDVDFSDRWFTILTGVNGSGKSAVLKKIKEQYTNETILYNPIRNSVKQQLTQAINNLETGNRKKNNLLSDLNKGWDDTNAVPYPSFQETVVAEFREYMTKDTSKSQDAILEDIEKEYAALLKEIFPDYKAVNWKVDSMGPVFEIKKYEKYELVADQLSTGEQEVLSLVFSINSVRDNCKILLIDEPEQHLNWALEKNLFSYLKRFSTKNKVQVIIATHSRAIFDKKFKENCIYLYFDKERNIVANSTAPEGVLEQIAGEAVSMLVTSEDYKTVYVEDDLHKKVVDKLVELLNSKTNIDPIVSINVGTVVNLYKTAAKNPTSPAFKNTYFMVDGDNKPDKYLDDDRYIHLGKNKCMETYFLNFDYLDKISRKNKVSIKKKFCSLVNQAKKQKAKTNLLYQGKITESNLQPAFVSRYDPKDIWRDFIKFVGFNSKDDLIDKYLRHVTADKRRLKATFDKKLLKLLEVE